MISKEMTCGDAEVTTAGGIWGAATQQSCFELLPGTLLWEQQLCAPDCAGTMNVPIENNRTAIRAMAVAVR